MARPKEIPYIEIPGQTELKDIPGVMPEERAESFEASTAELFDVEEDENMVQPVAGKPISQEIPITELVEEEDAEIATSQPQDLSLIHIWRYTPWFTMILLSGLLNISKDYYEAATVDGANGIQQFWYITLPSLKNILFFCSVTLTVDMWKLFNESYILPGPGTSNTSLFQYMYESGFNVFNMGYASAIGVVLILILIVISVIQFIVRHKQGEI